MDRNDRLIQESNRAERDPLDPAASALYKRQKVSEDESVPRPADSQPTVGLGMGSASWLKIEDSLAKSVAAMKAKESISQKQVDQEAIDARAEEQQKTNLRMQLA